MLKKEDESFSLSITFLFCYVASHMCWCVCWSESSPRPRMFDLTCLQRISLANPFDEYLSLHIISQSSSHSHFHDDAKTCAREKFFWTLFSSQPQMDGKFFLLNSASSKKLMWKWDKGKPLRVIIQLPAKASTSFCVQPNHFPSMKMQNRTISHGGANEASAQPPKPKCRTNNKQSIIHDWDAQVAPS